MVCCEQCGSIQIARAKPEFTDKVLGFFGARRPFVCRRCGWRALRLWKDTDLVDPNARSGGAELDPSLAALDDSDEKSVFEKRDRQKTAEHTMSSEFGLAELDLSSSETGSVLTSDQPVTPLAPSERPSVAQRRKRSQRREIAAATIASVLVLVVVVLSGFIGSCGSTA